MVSQPSLNCHIIEPQNVLCSFKSQMSSYHVTIFLLTVYYNGMQNSSSNFQLWVMSFDLLSHCVVSSLKLIPVLIFWDVCLKLMRCCFVHAAVSVTQNHCGLQLLSTQMLIATLTHILLHFFLCERFACVDGGWRGKYIILFYWNAQRADIGNGWVENLLCPRNGQ